MCEPWCFNFCIWSGLLWASNTRSFKGTKSTNISIQGCERTQVYAFDVRINFVECWLVSALTLVSEENHLHNVFI